MIDTNVALRKALLLDAPLVALVGQRIHLRELPADANPMAQPSLVYFTRGGSTDRYVPLTEPSVQFDCWGKDALTARGLYRALHDALHGKENVDLGADGYLLSAFEEVPGQDLLDAETKWSRVVTFFRVQFRR